MLTIALVSLILSYASAYLAGYAFIAPRESFFRSKIGVWVVIGVVLSFVTLPPTLPGLAGSMGEASAVAPGLGDVFAWPAAVSPGLYLALWTLGSTGAALVGMQVWRAGKPGWRSPAGNAWDSSAAGRARGLLPLADSIDDALDVLARTRVDARGARSMATDLRTVGGRFAESLPPDTAAVYRLVASKLDAPVAAEVTGLLLEGAGRKTQSS